MKKIIFGLIAFGVVCFATTGVLIYSHNQKIAQEEKHDIIEKSGDVSTEIKSGETSGENKKDEETISGDIKENNKEKTLDLDGTYNENDIIMNEILENYNGVEIKIPQISGLKNKVVENKINNSIREKVHNIIEEYSSKNNIIELKANFSNVISIYMAASAKGKYKNFYFNYELVNGEELKLEDLLTQNADVYTIARRAFYRQKATDILNSGPEFDQAKNAWYNYEYHWDENAHETIKQKKEYIIDENEIAEKIESILSSSENQFFFTPQKLYLRDYACSVNFADIADEVVIYDKYLTDESLYERDDIGLKNLFTCAFSCSNVVKYQDYKMFGDNLFYDIAIIKEGEILLKDGSEAVGVKEKIYELLKEKSYEKLEEYKELANQNPNKFYAVIIRPHASAWDFENNIENTYFINVQLEIRLEENQESKEVNLEKLRKGYRYHNVPFYGSPGDYYFDTFFVIDPKLVEWYDFKTLEKIDIEKYYDENEEYRAFLDNLIKTRLLKKYPTVNTNLEIESIKYDAGYDDEYYGWIVTVYFKENEYEAEKIRLYTHSYWKYYSPEET